MSATRLTCPSCQTRLKLAGTVAPGKSVKCPRCGKGVRVPESAAEQDIEVLDEDGGGQPTPKKRPARRDEAGEREEAPPRKSNRAREEEEPEEEFEEERPGKRGKARRPKKAKQGSPALLWVGLAGGLVVLAGGVVLAVVLMRPGKGGGDGPGTSGGPATAPTTPATNKDKIIGTWLVTASPPGGFEIPSTMEFTKGGRAVNTSKAVVGRGETKDVVEELDYAVDGDTIKIGRKGDPGHAVTGTIKTLTDKSLVLDIRGQEFRFIRRAGGSVPVPREKLVVVKPGGEYTAEVGETVTFLFPSIKKYTKLEVQVDGKALADPRQGAITSLKPGESGPYWKYTPETPGTLHVQVTPLLQANTKGEAIPFTLKVSE